MNEQEEITGYLRTETGEEYHTRHRKEEIQFTCVKCKETKFISEFYKPSMNRIGRRRECKACACLDRRNQYAKDDSVRLAKLKYGKTPMARYTRLKSSAKRRGTAFTLDKLEFLMWFEGIPKYCSYCDVSLNTNGNRAEQLTVDRKDNSVGYRITNIVLSCQRCNTIKGDLFSEDEMLEIAQRYIKPKLEVSNG